MPLHLLGKKSWNVYNPDNIARVRRDEAIAQAQDEKHEAEQRNSAASSRLQLLRGEQPPDTLSSGCSSASSNEFNVSRKRRRLAGEDDTDRDIRLAKNNTEAVSGRKRDVDLFDAKGHIDLLPKDHKTLRNVEEPETDAALGGMRLKDAAGYKHDEKPWYTNNEASRTTHDSQVSRDVWGNDDPRRRERAQQRLNATDPLSAMKNGIKRLRENDRQRKEWMEQRERDLYEVERLARRNETTYRRQSSVEDSLEGFNLDAQSKEHHRSKRPQREERHHNDDGHRRRSRSPERRDHRHRHRHRHRSRDKQTRPLSPPEPASVVPAQA